MNEKRTYKYRCRACQNKLQKRSKTAAGKQRWHCLGCNRSTTKPRLDLRRGFLLEAFVSWLLGKASQDELRQSARSFRDQTSWCWDVAPPHVLSGEIHHAIIVDGIRVGGMVCLIARTTSYVIAWVWVPYESSQYWSELLRLLPAPNYVVCDGQKGLLKALAICWPEAVIQRCRFHVWLNVKAKLTLHPEAIASQELLKLTRDLLQVRTKQQARRWKRRLKHWHRKHHKFVNERTIKQQPKPNERRWRYTHERLRSAYRQLAKLTDDSLRSSYRPSPELSATTNHIEGGINSQIRTKLKAHRGMSPAHQMRLVDWYLYSRSEDPKPPRKCL
ncbi:MAG: IS1249 family transposase [Actinobacteria bacterium]|nr:IS1249 family transposase [Actinomycetota bacterium]